MLPAGQLLWSPYFGSPKKLGNHQQGNIHKSQTNCCPTDLTWHPDVQHLAKTSGVGFVLGLLVSVVMETITVGWFTCCHGDEKYRHVTLVLIKMDQNLLVIRSHEDAAWGKRNPYGCESQFLKGDTEHTFLGLRVWSSCWGREGIPLGISSQWTPPEFGISSKLNKSPTVFLKNRIKWCLFERGERDIETER